MKLSRLSGLLFLSLLLTAFWLSISYGAEDPWDENKIVVSDSGSALGDGTIEPVFPPWGGKGMSSIYIPGVPWCTKIIQASYVLISNAVGNDLKKSSAQHSAMLEAKKLRIGLPEGDPIKTKR